MKLYPLLSLFLFKPLLAVAQLPIPYPYGQPIGLTATQLRHIQEIHSAITTELTEQERKDKKLLIEFNDSNRTAYRTDTDTCGLNQRLHFFYDARERGEIDSLLTPLQRSQVAMWLECQEREIAIVNFDKYKRRQQGNLLCWAACLEIVLNYDGIRLPQDQIIQLVGGELINQEADLQQMMTNLNGAHMFSLDSGRTSWMAYIDPMSNDVEGLLMNIMTPFPVGPDMSPLMMEGGSMIRFALVGIRHHHLAVVDRMVYRQRGPWRIPIRITYYDPLDDRDITIQAKEIPEVVTEWFSCYATKWQVYTPLVTKKTSGKPDH